MRLCIVNYKYNEEFCKALGVQVRKVREKKVARFDFHRENGVQRSNITQTRTGDIVLCMSVDVQARNSAMKI